LKYKTGDIAKYKRQLIYKKGRPAFVVYRNNRTYYVVFIYVEERNKWYTSCCEEEDLSDYTGEVPAGAETFQKLASIRYDKRELTSNRMTYNVSFVEENSVYKIVDLLNNPKDDYRHYLWLHSRNYFGYNYNVSLY
jgi:hypothetical protein